MTRNGKMVLEQEDIRKYGLSAAGIIGLLSLFLPVFQVGKTAYNMPALLRLSKGIGMGYFMLLVSVILLSLAGTLVVTLWERNEANLTGGVLRVSSAVLLVLIKMMVIRRMTGVAGGFAIGSWIFLIVHLACGGAGVWLYLSGKAEHGKGKSRSQSSQQSDAEKEKPKRSGIIYIQEGVYKGEEIELGDMETLLVGRDASQCNLIIEGEKASRKHCSITYCARMDSYLLCDYSFNGTYYKNGQRLPKHMNLELPEGTVIYLGDKKNVLRLGR